MDGSGSSSPCRDLPARSADSRSSRRSAFVAARQQTGGIIQVDNADPLVLQLVSFEGRTDLLRGSRLSSVMRRGAAILSSPAGSAATFDLSEEVTAIATFISHNWSVPRARKFFCLALYFNFRSALLVAVGSTIAIAAATSQELLPRVVIDAGRVEPGMCGTVLVTPIFLLVVCFGHDLRRLVGCTSSLVFLDKTCIHQSDAKRKQEGILKLGAFIQSSASMLIVYSDVYLKKLWTVYEVACFLSMHPTRRLAVISPCTPLFVLGGTTSLYLARALTVLLQFFSRGGSSTIAGFELICAGLNCYAMVVLLRYLARTKESITQRLEHFRAEECLCVDEADREIVCRNIALLVRATGEVDSGASQEEAIWAFNRLVRRRLSGPLRASVGLQYFHCVAIFLCSQAPSHLDGYFGKYPFPEGPLTRMQICRVMILGTLTFGIIPLLMLSASTWCGRCLNFSGWVEHAFLLFGSVLFTLLVSIARFFLNQLFLLSIHHDAGVAGLVVVMLSMIALAASAIAFERRAQRRMEEAKEDSEAGAAGAWVEGGDHARGSDPCCTDEPIEHTTDSDDEAVARPRVRQPKQLLASMPQGGHARGTYLHYDGPQSYTVHL